jgi:hypothetical protein
MTSRHWWRIISWVVGTIRWGRGEEGGSMVTSDRWWKPESRGRWSRFNWRWRKGGWGILITTASDLPVSAGRSQFTPIIGFMPHGNSVPWPKLGVNPKNPTARRSAKFKPPPPTQNSQSGPWTESSKPTF